MALPPKLTTSAACRVAGLHRDRFNEHVASEHFSCAPCTVPGRARLFDPDDMVALWLFRQLMDDGMDARTAGRIACSVADTARNNPTEPVIAYVEHFNGRRSSIPAPIVPVPALWGDGDTGGFDIRKVTTFNIAKVRRLIEHYTEEERSIIGEKD